MGVFADRLALGRGLYITWWTLTHKRQYVIDKIKAPLRKDIEGLSVTGSTWRSRILAIIEIIRMTKRFPEPTREHTSAPNTHRLIDIQDEFFEYENNPGREKLFRAIWKIFIWVYEHDGYYRSRIDWVIEKIHELIETGLWEPRKPNTPKNHWREFDK